MPQTLTLKVTAHTDAGRVRESNEDAVFADAGLGLLVLADGMGGHRAGEVASRLAVETVVDTLRAADPNDADETRLRNAVEAANQRVRAAAATPEFAGMGTTLAVALIRDQQLCSAHAGDSRIYLWRDNLLRHLTRDHSEIELLIERGMSRTEAERLGRSNVITRALGIGDTVDADYTRLELHAQDVILLCSDGLTDMLDDAEIATVLRQTEADPERCAHRLLGQANAAGGRDNISVVLARLDED